MENQKKEQSVHMVDLFNRLLIKGLENKIIGLEETIDTYRGFNWADLKTKSDQLKTIQNMTKKLNSALEENRLLKLEVRNSKALANMAKVYMTGETNVTGMIQGLQSGKITEFLNTFQMSDDMKNKRSVRIPSLTDLGK
ncbi:hypothetical protein [Mucilaginibacter paludis]|uniref:Uncharacterized protein n=1 Tax=Mucilaginibacter paludis DSM 18603 TaxID=714943 RepID=H1Y7C2_9SPHI|nr:hypothetical protein [Mucilaginibacter paludis]EHQ29009.1 hypothetical protein Mucpa_4925 [Mucilaginibacter paludis DSM 18603]